jgi:hypothetical protein
MKARNVHTAIRSTARCPVCFAPSYAGNYFLLYPKDALDYKKKLRAFQNDVQKESSRKS